MKRISGSHTVFADPARVNLRKAARATIVVPALFAVLVATGNTPSSLFVAFGSFAALVFADFGGALPRRFRAYIGLLVVGALLVALGTAFADTIWPAVVATFVVAFAVAFSGSLGGYFASGATAATLAFVLAVMSPAVDADLWARELGWVVGVGVAGVAAVLLWPVHQRDRVRAAAATVMHEAATVVASPPGTRDLTATRAADDALADRAGVIYRPAGSITRERALVALVIAVRRLVPLLEAMTAAEQSVDADPSAEYRQLAECVAANLDAATRVLDGDRGAKVDLDALASARAAHTTALQAWTAATLDAADASRVIGRFRAAFPMRRLSLAADRIARDASIAAHDAPRSPRDRVALLRPAWLILRAHCNVRSVRFRNAARAGLGLAVAVYVAKTTSVEHAFWVVLGALAVLRSSALGTGATALQALAGALIGFTVATAFMETVGGDDTVLWIVLPVVVFLAAYTPGVANFVVGQASFTLFVVVLFNVLDPAGWRTGLVRVQDVAIGAGISVVVGALLWPRGARGVARREFADLLRAGKEHLRLALAAALDGGSTARAVAAGVAADDARARAVAALEDLALEHGGGHVDREAWGTLLVDATLLQLAADGVGRTAAAYGTATGCDEARASLHAEGHEVMDRLDREAASVEAAGVVPARPDAAPGSEVPAGIGACLTGHAHDGLTAAVGVVWIHEWLALVDARLARAA